MTAIYLISLVLIGAVADGLNFAGHGTAGHSLEALEILMLMTGPVVLGMKKWKPLILFVVAYTLIRFALFSYAFNLTAGLPWDYIGVVDPVDKLIGLFKAPSHGWLFAKFWILLAGITVAERDIQRVMLKYSKIALSFFYGRKKPI